jgi:hypothetical protein
LTAPVIVALDAGETDVCCDARDAGVIAMCLTICKELTERAYLAPQLPLLQKEGLTKGDLPWYYNLPSSAAHAVTGDQPWAKQTEPLWLDR